MPTTPTVRIFFSSPGDVKMERETARRIVERLQAEIGPRANLEPYFWEHEVMVATKDYQQNIPSMDGFDVVVCILWSRLGSPLNPERHPRPGGGFFESGTEYEFFMAMQAHQSRGAPDVLVFRNRTEPRRPSRPKEAREAVDREIDRLDHFFERYFKTGDFFTAAVNSYRTLGEFEDRLTQGLRAFLEQHLPAAGARVQRVATYGGRPYLGLAAFEFADAPVFFGRTAQVGQVVQAFQAQELEARAGEEEGRRFVLVLGASGSGKSSLARAGVMPMIVQPGVIEGAHAWRRAILKPGESGGDPFLALANALLAPEALPELASDGTNATALASLLRRQGGGAGLLLRQALSQAGAAARSAEEQRLRDRLRQLEGDQREEDARELRERLGQLAAPAMRLALLVDQLEELFTTDQAGDVTAAFVECLASMAHSGRVFVLATLRSDFYASCLAHPRLVELMRGSGSFALPAPGPAELGQMIRQPAAVAGLVFEENSASGEKLDELLRDAAMRDPAALPLLGYALEQLHEQRTKDGVLTLAAYRNLGGLEGAIGKRAEEVFTSLSGEAQAAFDRVLRQLVTLGEDGAPVRRRMAHAVLAATPGARALVDGLVNARLLTADQDGAGERTISVVHEALLRHWPRVVQWVEENREFLRARSRLASRLSEWLEQEQDEHFLIPSGPPLGEAESILARHADVLDRAEVEYIERSKAHARARDLARQQRNRRITTGAVALSVLALIGGAIAWRERGIADGQRAEAVQQKNAAERNARAALANQTRAAYLLGIEMLERGKTRDGLTSLAQALLLDPQHFGARDRLYSHHLYGLPKAISLRSVTGPDGIRQSISGADGGPVQRCAYLDARGAPEVFDLASVHAVAGPWFDQTGASAVFLNRTSSHLVCYFQDKRCRTWSLADGQAGDWVTLEPLVQNLSLSDDGKRLVEGSSDGHVRVLDAVRGTPLHEWRQSAGIGNVELDSQRSLVAAAGGDVVIFDLAHGREIARLADPDWTAVRVRVAPAADVCVIEQRARPAAEATGERFVFVTTSTGQPHPTARILPVTSEVLDFALNEDGSILAVGSFSDVANLYGRDDAALDRRFSHATYPALVRLSPDERLLLTASSDGTVRIFDVDTRELAFEPINHDGRLEDLLLSWDGRYLLTSTARRARVWDLSVGRALTLPLRQDGTPFAVRFDESGRTLWTAASSSGVQAWDARTLEPRGSALFAGKDLWGGLIDQLGKHAVVMTPERELVFLDLSSGQAVGETFKAPEGALYWSFSGDGTCLGLGAGDQVVFVDSSTGHAVGTPWTLPSEDVSLSLSHSGRVAAASAGQGQQVLLHDVRSGKDTTLDTSGISALTLRFSADDRWLAASGMGTGTAVEHVALVWDLRAPQSPPRKLAHDDRILDLCLSPDGQWLATGTKGQIAQVWNVSTGRAEANPIFLANNVVRGVRFSPDGRLLAVHGGDNTLRLYDWREACPVSQVLDVQNNLVDFAFSPDATRIVAQSASPQDASRSYARVFEVSPSPSMPLDLVALTEAATALHVSPDGLPTACDPFEGWERLRRAAPDLWFFQSPARRSISPAFACSSLRWIQDEAIGVRETGLAMPAVNMVRAAMSFWNLRNLKTRITALGKLDAASEEAQRESAELTTLSRTVDSLARTAARGATDDPATCLWLSLQQEASGNMEDARRFVDDALRLAPDDRDVLNQASDVYLGVKDCAAERQVLQRLREIEPEAVKHRNRLGFNGWRCGDRTLAQREFAAILDDPSITPMERADMLVCLGRSQEALAYWKTEAENARTAGKELDADTIVRLSIAHQLAGQPGDAVEWFEKLVAQLPLAADPEAIAGIDLLPEYKAALLAAQTETLKRHPELRAAPR